MLGALLGHQFDQGLGTRLAGARRSQSMIFDVTFEVMGHLAKADGRVNEDEIQVARRVMHEMRLLPAEVKAAIACFNSGKHAQYPFRLRLGELQNAIGHQRALARGFVEIQVQAAVGAGDIDTEKRKRLWEVAHMFGISRAELAQIEAVARARRGQRMSGAAVTLEEAYRALGIGPEATDQDVKTAYRRLMNQHHPDKLVSRGLPQSMAPLAEQKTREIRMAYDRIKEARGIK